MIQLMLQILQLCYFIHLKHIQKKKKKNELLFGSGTVAVINLVKEEKLMVKIGHAILSFYKPKFCLTFFFFCLLLIFVYHSS